MKISLVINSLAGGGAERRFQSLANYWCRAGMQVQLVSLESGDQAYMTDDGVEVVCLDKAIKGGLRKTIAIPQHARSLAKHFSRFSPDVTISALARANLSHVLARKFGGPAHPIVLSEANSTAITYGGGEASKRLMRFLIRSIYPAADDVIAISTGVRDSLCSIGVDPSVVRVVSNPIDLDLVSLRAEENHTAIERRHRYRLVAMGRLVAVKNYPFILNALALIRQRCDAELLVIGDGPQREQLVSLAQECGVADAVEWVGWQSNPFPHLKSADIFVHAPLHEGFGNILVEAMQLGVPVVCLESPGGVHDIIDGPESGIVVTEPSADAFAREVCDLLGNPARISALSIGGKKRAQHFGVAKIAAQYLAVALAIVERRA